MNTLLEGRELPATEGEHPKRICVQKENKEVEHELVIEERVENSKGGDEKWLLVFCIVVLINLGLVLAYLFWKE